MLDLGFGGVHEVVLLEQDVVNQETIGPDVDLGTIGLFSEQFGGHEDRSAYYVLVYLFFDGKTEISQFVYHMPRVPLIEYVVGFYVPVDYFPPRNKLQSSGQLVRYFKGLGFRNGSPLGDHVLQTTIRAELQNHDHIMLGQETVKDPRGKQTIRFDYLGKLLQHAHLLT